MPTSLTMIAIMVVRSAIHALMVLPHMITVNEKLYHLYDLEFIYQPKVEIRHELLEATIEFLQEEQRTMN